MGEFIPCLSPVSVRVRFYHEFVGWDKPGFIGGCCLFHWPMDAPGNSPVTSVLCWSLVTVVDAGLTLTSPPHPPIDRYMLWVLTFDFEKIDFKQFWQNSLGSTPPTMSLPRGPGESGDIRCLPGCPPHPPTPSSLGTRRILLQGFLSHPFLSWL